MMSQSVIREAEYVRSKGKFTGTWNFIKQALVMTAETDEKLWRIAEKCFREQIQLEKRSARLRGDAYVCGVRAREASRRFMTTPSGNLIFPRVRILDDVIDSINEKNKSKMDKEKALEFAGELYKCLEQLSAATDKIERWEATKKCECNTPKNDIKRSSLLIRRIAACIIDFENDVTGATLNVDLGNKNPHCC